MKHKAIIAIGVSVLLLIYLVNAVSCSSVYTQITCTGNLNNQIKKQLIIGTKEKELSNVDIFTNMNTQVISKVRKTLSKATINNIFHYEETKYLDYSIDDNRYITEFHSDGQVNKSIQFLDDNDCLKVYINNNNQSITELTEPSLIYNQGEKKECSQSAILDPIIQSNQYIIPYTGKETYREKIMDNEKEYISLHETFDELNVTEATYIQLESDMSIAALALFLRVSLDAVCKWLENTDMITEKQNIIPQGTLVCIKKVINFRYGREIYFNKLNIYQQIYDTWSNGTISYSLRTEGILYDENNCIEYQVIKSPHAMRLCDEYYRNLGFELITQIPN